MKFKVKKEITLNEFREENILINKNNDEFVNMVFNKENILDAKKETKGMMRLVIEELKSIETKIDRLTTNDNDILDEFEILDEINYILGDEIYSDLLFQIDNLLEYKGR